MKDQTNNTTHSHNSTNYANRYTKSTNRTDCNNRTTGANRTTKKIANWSEYNKALVSRGNISILISEDIIKDGHIVPPGKTNRVGRPREYSDQLIRFTLAIRVLLNLALRQTSGYISHLFKLMGLTAEIPCYTTLSRRMGQLNLRPHRLVNHIRRLSGISGKGKDIVMLVDSSGFKVYGEGEWKVRKHGYSYRRTWRETHIAVDFETRDIIGLTSTSAHTHDNTQLIPLLEQVQQDYCSDSGNCSDCNGGCNSNSKIKTIIGDGAYHARENYINITRKQGIELITPPSRGAVEHLNTGWHYQWYDTPGWEERNRVVRYVDKYGLAKWKKDTNYHRRSLVENTFYRLKTIFGERLKSRTAPNQLVEQQLKASIINTFNALGLPKYEN